MPLRALFPLLSAAMAIAALVWFSMHKRELSFLISK